MAKLLLGLRTFLPLKIHMCLILKMGEWPNLLQKKKPNPSTKMAVNVSFSSLSNLEVYLDKKSSMNTHVDIVKRKDTDLLLLDERAECEAITISNSCFFSDLKLALMERIIW